MKKSITYLFVSVVVLLCAIRPVDSEPIERNQGKFESRDFSFIVQEATTYKSNTDKAFLAVGLDFINLSETKKLDLSTQFGYSLIDDFGNEYRMLPAQEDYPYELNHPNTHFPSLYPGETFHSTIFFEAPIASSKNLLLMIDASATGIVDQINLGIPIERVKIPKAVVTKREPHDQDIVILNPPDQSKIYPGQVVHLEVALSQEIDPPDLLYIISPNYVFEDVNVALKYDVRIPKNEDFGPVSIIVMAKWQEVGPAHGEMAISQSIMLNVVDPLDDCLEDCLTKTAVE